MEENKFAKGVHIQKLLIVLNKHLVDLDNRFPNLNRPIITLTKSPAATDDDEDGDEEYDPRRGKRKPSSHASVGVPRVPSDIENAFQHGGEIQFLLGVFTVSTHDHHPRSQNFEIMAEFLGGKEEVMDLYRLRLVRKIEALNLEFSQL